MLTFKVAFSLFSNINQSACSILDWLWTINQISTECCISIIGNFQYNRRNSNALFQATAGWIGFSSICGSCVSSVLMSMVADHFKRRTKLFLKIMMAISIILFIILVCIQEKYFTLPQHAVVRKWPSTNYYFWHSVSQILMNLTCPTTLELLKVNHFWSFGPKSACWSVLPAVLDALPLHPFHWLGCNPRPLTPP